MEAREYLPNTGNSFMADELLPCPFCGGEPELKFVGNDYTKSRKATIKCKKCRAEITNAALKHDSKWCAMVSIEDWNKREYHQHQLEESDKNPEEKPQISNMDQYVIAKVEARQPTHGFIEIVMGNDGWELIKKEVIDQFLGLDTWLMTFSKTLN